jgi:hypothetical protein
MGNTAETRQWTLQKRVWAQNAEMWNHFSEIRDLKCFPNPAAIQPCAVSPWKFVSSFAHQHWWQGPVRLLSGQWFSGEVPPSEREVFGPLASSRAFCTLRNQHHTIPSPPHSLVTFLTFHYTSNPVRFRLFCI